jgi:hypothetical protein
MRMDWLPRALVPLLISLVLTLFRRMAPPRYRATEHRYDEMQSSEPLPSGVVGGAMWATGIALALTFFLLRDANRLWAKMEGEAEFTQYATAFLWAFFPGFAALAVPWPFVVWWLRKVGRWEEADSTEDDSDTQSGGNSYQIMKWMCIGLVMPIGLFTIPAIPIHLSISGNEVRVGHYAQLHPERFQLDQAVRLTMIDGSRLSDGSFRPAKDIIVDFADGRRLRGNAVGDGGTNVQDQVVKLLIDKTGLKPGYAQTVDDIPLLKTAR